MRQEASGWSSNEDTAIDTGAGPKQIAAIARHGIPIQLHGVKIGYTNNALVIQSHDARTPLQL